MTAFMSKYDGPLTNLFKWSQWDTLVDTLRQHNDGNWYAYFVGNSVPTTPLIPDKFTRLLEELTVLLRKDHDESYLGIVYADNPEYPEFIKIYDPNNLGSSCGSSGQRVLPGWTLSRVPPVDLHVNFPLPNNRQRWWQQLFT